ncbi:MAG: TIM-barrel domain-containing protein [Promethearchaeota archaeon]
MPIKINPIKVLFYYIKERLKHPFSFNKRLFELSEPNIIYGLSDHPLDIYGDPIQDPYTIIPKSLGKKAYVVREIVKLKQHNNNIFDFDCNGYNIYLFRPVPEEVAKEYPIPKLGRKPIKMTLRIIFLQPNIYRVLCKIGEKIPEHHTEMVIKDIKNNLFSIEFDESDKFFTLQTSELILKLYKNDFRIKIFDKNMKFITESSGRSKNHFASALDSFPIGFIKDKKSKKYFSTESFVIYPGEAIYGLGEQYSSLNKVGQTISLWNYEGCGNTSGRTYKNIPFFISTRGYGVYVNDHNPITFWVGSREFCKNIWATEADIIDYFFFYGPDFKTILYNYTELTGKAPVPPKWSFGAWMSRISYSSQKEVLEVAKRLRKEKFPFDVIHIDTNWFKEEWMCDWKFDNEKFPDPKQMCAELKKLGFKVSLWQTPYIVKRVKEYKEAKKLGIAAKNHGAFMFLFTPALVIDFSNPESIKWYQNKLLNLFKIGVSVIKIDFGEAVEPHQKFLKYNGREMHNLFALLYQKAAFEISREFFGRGIIWARSAYAGSQRYPVHWSGDSSSTFEELPNVLRGGLSIGLCGFTFWSQDVGGFIFSPSDRLFIRWTQFSIFNSHIRFHGNPPKYREPWNYSEQAQEIVRKFLNLRYRLIHYIYTEAHYASKHGLPMLAPLVLEFQNDPTVFNIEDQFMFGRNLMVAPIFTKYNERLIYIPQGKWYDYWTLKKYEGNSWINYECSIDNIPFFIKEGTILPLGPVIQYIDDKDLNSLDLIIIPDFKENIIQYEIIEDDMSLIIDSEIVENTLKIKLSRPIKIVKVILPKISNISEIILNNKKLDIQQDGNKVIGIK